jgi:hypothetical protein
MKIAVQIAVLNDATDLFKEMGTIRETSQRIFCRRVPGLVIRQALDLGLEQAPILLKKTKVMDRNAGSSSTVEVCSSSA